MKLSDIKSLGNCALTLEAAKRLDNDDVKGLQITVVFDGQDNNDVPVQMFLSTNGPDFQTVMDIVTNLVNSAREDSKAKVKDIIAKLSEVVS